MNGRKKYLKALAFVPALVLAGGFVGYRAGAFPADFFRPSGLAEPQPAPDAPPSESQPAAGSDPTFMPGSKYIVVTPPPAGSTAPQAAPPASAGSPTFMAGSKSMILVPAPQAAQPTPGAAPAATPPAPTPPNPAIFYGSKSAPIFPAQPTPPAPPQP